MTSEPMPMSGREAMLQIWLFFFIICGKFTIERTWCFLSYNL